MSENYTISFDLSFILSIVHVQQSKYIVELLKREEQNVQLIFLFFLYLVLVRNYSEVQQIRVI